MPAVLRRVLHIALNRPRIFILTGGTLLVEVLLRATLAIFHPVLFVVCPPIVALPVLGAAAPTVHAAIANPDTTPEWRFFTMLSECGLRLCALAIGGHLIALALGASGFLLVDTVLRVAVYATGGTVPTVVVVLTPLVGVAAGTFVVWGLIAPAVAHAVAGNGLRDAAVASGRALATRRRTASALSLHVACILVGAGVFGVCFVLGNERYATADAALFSLLVGVAVTVATLVLLGVFVYPIHVALAAGDANEIRTLPIRRVALAAVLVAGSVVGAGAIRVTDAHPSSVPPVPTPFPGDATDAYATAIDRTDASDHRIVTREVGDGERMVSTTVVERSTRQYVNSHHYVNSYRSIDRTSVGYGDSGINYNFGGPYTFVPHSLGEGRVDNSVVRVLPYYWYVRDDYSITSGIGYSLPEPRTGTWTTVTEENGTRTLELTDGPAVFDALSEATAENGSYETAVVRMRVDTDRGVVLGGRARLNATVDDRRVVRNLSYVVESGESVDARRPAVLGPRSLGEWTWDLFAY